MIKDTPITITIEDTLLLVDILRKQVAAEDKTIILLLADNHKIDDIKVEGTAHFRNKERQRLARNKQRNSVNISKSRARKKQLDIISKRLNDQSIQRQVIAAMA